jgi:hypothetical protein
MAAEPASRSRRVKVAITIEMIALVWTYTVMAF